ncbi:MULTISPECIES: AAA family ATPase [unclassified Variovorax]|uniref:AAA family ATPase n=1 Tax=unclassified Variovorax TaxID=663243 RepID=UPI0008E799E2|nr:AAA family ATPase [Variovorax sp. PDC80]SFP76594.1 chromosome partitioning protein [Variovorax sp. PDC80]
MSKIAALATRAGSMVEQIRSMLLAPEARKVPPIFSTAQLAALCGVDKAHVAYRITKEDLPAGRLTPSGGKRNFGLDELRRWTRTYRADKMRPAGRKAVTIAVGNFKGGVAKTTTAMILAQGLSLRGHRVLAIDTDPQGSLTTLHGLLPEAEVTEDMTIGPLCDGTERDIRYAIRSTYWDGIDLVAAAPFLFSAEFALPARQMQEPGAKFWDVLNEGLESVRDLYDVIVIDTPPSLSYVTINALWAANGIVVPVPPSGLDFASSAQFWSLLADLGGNLDGQSKDREGKAFDFLHVLLSRVDAADPAMPAVRQWIQATYGEYTLPVEIPKTSVTSNKAAEFATVYDVQRYEGAAKTYKRAVDAYDAFVELVEQSVVGAWGAQGRPR